MLRRSQRNETRGMAVEGQPDIQQLLALIQQQNQQMQQMQNTQAAMAQQELQRREMENEKANQIRDNALAVRAAGGIVGYEGGRVLGPEESQFRTLLMSLGTNNDTADEIFRQGISSMNVVIDLTSDRLKNIMYTIMRNRSPDCPDPNLVFIGAVFEEKLSTLISWAQFQKQIGSPVTAMAWNGDPGASKKTNDRIQYYKEVKGSEATEDIPLPEVLKHMKEFMDFSDHLQAYLRIKRGAANVPLAYVIREEETVTDAERSGGVGPSPALYRNWDELAIRCTTLDGTHWHSDNTSFWQILSNLVRDGPGWDYIRRFEKNGDGDGRGAFMALKAQAFQYTNVRMIRQEAHQRLRSLRYDGPSKNWNYEKYVRAWLRNIRILKRFEDCPKEENLVSDFCRNISDARLDHAISQVLQESSTYINDFDSTQRYFNSVLGIQSSRNTTERKRSLSAIKADQAKSGTVEPYKGKIEGKHYPLSVWNQMTSQQQDTVRKLRTEAYNARVKKRQAAAVSSGGETTDDAKKNAGNEFGATAHGGKKRKKA